MDKVRLVLGGGVVEQLVPRHRGVQLGTHVPHGGKSVRVEDKKFVLRQKIWPLFFTSLFHKRPFVIIQAVIEFHSDSFPLVSRALFVFLLWVYNSRPVSGWGQTAAPCWSAYPHVWPIAEQVTASSLQPLSPVCHNLRLDKRKAELANFSLGSNVVQCPHVTSFNLTCDV